MITVFIGSDNANQRMMVRALVNNRPYFEVFGSDVEDLTSGVIKAKKVELLIVTDVVSIDQIDYLITSRPLFLSLPKPEIIIVTSTLKKSAFVKYEMMKLLTCISTDPKPDKKESDVNANFILIALLFASGFLNIVFLIYFFCFK